MPDDCLNCMKLETHETCSVIYHPIYTNNICIGRVVYNRAIYTG